MSKTQSARERADVVRRYVADVFNGRNYDMIAELQTEDFVQHGPMDGMEIRGNDEALELLQVFHGAFSDLEATEEFCFADGDMVCTLYTLSGTHDGDLMGIPATNRPGSISSIVINRIEDGKIAEAWPVVDFLGLLQQVDVVPALDEIAA